MQYNIIFLDMDGVMIPTDWNGFDRFKVFTGNQEFTNVSPLCLECLKMIHDDVIPDIKFVMNTAHRIFGYYTVENMINKGMPRDAFFPENGPWQTDGQYGKVESVNKWLDKNREIVYSAIVLEDTIYEYDVLQFSTETHIGLTLQKSKEIIKFYDDLIKDDVYHNTF